MTHQVPCGPISVILLLLKRSKTQCSLATWEKKTHPTFLFSNAVLPQSQVIGRDPHVVRLLRSGLAKCFLDA